MFTRNNKAWASVFSGRFCPVNFNHEAHEEHEGGKDEKKVKNFESFMLFVVKKSIFCFLNQSKDL